MSAFVAYQDFQPGPYGESKYRNKRVPEANAIYVYTASPDDKVAACLVAGQKTIQNRKVRARSWPNLSRSLCALALGRGLRETPDKPGPEPSRSNLLDRRMRLPTNRGGNRRQVGFAGRAEMLEALPNAPRARRWLPIQLFLIQCRDHILRGPIVCSKLARKPNNPRSRQCFTRCTHRGTPTRL
jgi:hypothetical protein